MDIPTSPSIPLVVDDRETRSVLFGHLRDTSAFAVAVERLPVGDYRVDGRFLFERKTLPDLVGSIQSGRLFRQALRLAAVSDLRPALVLEGTGRDLEGCGMRREAVQGAIVTLSLFFGLPVLRSRSTQETLDLFRFATLQGRTFTSGALPRRGLRPKGKRRLQCHLLQGLPGVGPERAARLLARFGTVAEVMSADEESLREVPGIGRNVARAIRWAVEEPEISYGTELTTSPAPP
jgi:ERCC4-type nuclease